MPTDIAELPTTETETDLSSVFDRALPETVEKEEPVKEIKVEKEPPKTEAKKESKKADAITAPDLPESVFTELPETTVKTEGESKEPEPTPVPENIKSESARESFKKLDQKRIDAEKKATAAELKVKEWETKAAAGDPDAKARIQQLEEQIRNADVIVQRANLELHPQFQAKYVIPRQQLLEQAQQAFKDGGGDPAQLEAALALKGKARADKLDELLGDITSKTLLSKIERAADTVERIDTEKDAVLKNASQWNQQLQKIEQVNRHKQLEQIAEEAKQNLQDASKVLGEQFKIGLFVPVTDPKYSWWNDEIKKMDAESEELMLRTDDPKQVAIAAKMAVAMPRAWNLFLQERKARIATQKRLAEYEDTTPGLGGRSAPKGGIEEADEDVPLTTAILASVKKAQAMG